ncbi:hypothetical protein OAN53_00085 [Porticoccaceae bacterium]|nr:hypothetical protein [Porticoccaceae bacterium]
MTDITNKLYRDFKANDINIDKSKRLLLDGITNSVIKGYLSSFQGEHYYQWIKKRKILEVLAEFDIGESRLVRANGSCSKSENSSKCSGWNGFGCQNV